jgi:hypothetical protein
MSKGFKASLHKTGYVCAGLALIGIGAWFFPVTAMAICVTAIVVIIVAKTIPRSEASPVNPVPSKRVAKGLAKTVAKNGDKDNEEVLLWESRTHPLNLWPWWIGIIALPSILVHATMATEYVTWQIAILAGLIGMSAFGLRFWLWRVDRICITNKRLLTVTGILLVSYKTMPLSKLTDLTVDFSRLSTILGWLGLIREPYAKLVVESAGQDQALSRVSYVPHGHQANSLIMQRVL